MAYGEEFPNIFLLWPTESTRNFGGRTRFTLGIVSLPVGRWFIPLFTGCYTSQVVVWDFFHQQYCPLLVETEVDTCLIIFGTVFGADDASRKCAQFHSLPSNRPRWRWWNIMEHPPFTDDLSCTIPCFYFTMANVRRGSTHAHIHISAYSSVYIYITEYDWFIPLRSSNDHQDFCAAKENRWELKEGIFPHKSPWEILVDGSEIQQWDPLCTTLVVRISSINSNYGCFGFYFCCTHKFLLRSW